MNITVAKLANLLSNSFIICSDNTHAAMAMVSARINEAYEVE